MKNTYGDSMRDSFVTTLIEIAKQDKTIELVTGDLGFGVLKPFWEQLPDQFTNAGVAEQNMTALAAGMAREGKNVFTYSIIHNINYLLRNLFYIIHFRKLL